MFQRKCDDNNSKGKLYFSRIFLRVFLVSCLIFLSLGRVSPQNSELDRKFIRPMYLIHVTGSWALGRSPMIEKHDYYIMSDKKGPAEEGPIDSDDSSYTLDGIQIGDACLTPRDALRAAQGIETDRLPAYYRRWRNLEEEESGTTSSKPKLTGLTIAAIIALSLAALKKTVDKFKKTKPEDQEDKPKAKTSKADESGHPAEQPQDSVPPPKRETQKKYPPIIDPDTGNPMAVNDGSYEGGHPGQVWVVDEWVDRDKALEYVNDRKKQIAKRDKERADFQEESQRKEDAWFEEKEAEADEWRQKREKDQARKNAQEAADKEAQDRLAENIKKMAEKEGDDFKEEMDRHLANKDYVGLKALFRDKLKEQIDKGVKDSKSEDRWATAATIAEKMAQAALAGAKGGMMVVGGPAGMVATGLGVGTISAAEGGADSYYRGDSGTDVIKHTGLGFLGGSKDGAVSVFSNLPGTGKAAKYLLPAAGDFGETYIRTDDWKKSLTAAGVSLASDGLGAKIDKIDTSLIKEAAKAGLSGTAAGTMNYVNGGTFNEGFQNGLLNHAGGVAGGKQAKKKAAEVDSEAGVKKALDDAKQGPKVIPMDQQAEIVQKLNDTMYKDNDYFEGKKIIDAAGKEVKVDYVDTRLALDQLMDTKASRTAKKSPKDIRNAIINTRNDKIYAPADDVTLAKVRTKLEAQGLLKPGDKLKMDTFSTPGEAPSLGADRDARLVVINRIDPETGRNMKIEVDRKHWENEAYKDFYDHTQKIATNDGQNAITDKTHPDYFKRLEELQHMKRPETPQEIDSLLKRGYTPDQIAGFQKQGLSSDQIKHRAWAEAHNQLFTDRLHMEASADNADQAIDRVIQTAEGSKVEQGQKPLPGVMDAKDGKAALLDPEGYSRMWQEKSRFYEDIIPAEAIAQSQKGIAQYMKIRDGYRIQNIEPPPLNPRTAKAMEVIVKAQVGVKATEGQLAVVKGQLKDLGFKDISDAMKHIANENEILKWSKPGAATVPVRDLNATDLARISRPDLTTAAELEELMARLASGKKIL